MQCTQMYNLYLETDLFIIGRSRDMQSKNFTSLLPMKILRLFSSQLVELFSKIFDLEIGEYHDTQAHHFDDIDSH